jgi:hypothetical protein
MAVETADDRAIFIGVDDFGVAATYNGATINGIFDNDFVEVDAGGGVGFALQQPRFVCRTADVINRRRRRHYYDQRGGLHDADCAG